MPGQTFIELLDRSSSRITFDDQGALTAPELADRGRRIAGAFTELGLAPGARIGVWLDSGHHYLDLLAACAAGRFVLVNVNTRYNPAEVAALLHRSGASIVVTDRGAELQSDVRLLPASRIDDLSMATPTEQLASADDPFLVFTTSGTTSRPKMVLHQQHSIVSHANAVATAFKLTPTTPSLIALPLCGVFGLDSLTAAIAGDCPIWIVDRFDADNVASLVSRQSIVAMNGTDDMFHRMLATDADLSSLAICGYAAFNASLDDIVERAEQRGVRLGGVYGMSEVQGLLTFRQPDLPASQRRKAGGRFSSPNARVRIVDPHGDPTSDQVLAHSVDGEIQLKGPSLFAGYLAEGGDAIDADLTAAAMAGGWFRTGDLGSTTPVADGKPAEFTFVTRMGDVLRLGGFLVAPAEIEEVILGYDGIADVQVVAAPTPNGSRPVAFVIADNASPDAVTNDEAGIISHCAGSLAKFKCPVRVIWLDEFPITDGPNGVKIQRSRLRELAAEAL